MLCNKILLFLVFYLMQPMHNSSSIYETLYDDNKLIVEYRPQVIQDKATISEIVTNERIVIRGRTDDVVRLIYHKLYPKTELLTTSHPADYNGRLRITYYHDRTSLSAIFNVLVDQFDLKIHEQYKMIPILYFRCHQDKDSKFPCGLGVKTRYDDVLLDDAFYASYFNHFQPAKNYFSSQNMINNTQEIIYNRQEKWEDLCGLSVFEETKNMVLTSIKFK